MLRFRRLIVCLSNRLEAFVEPDSGAAGPRAARARPHHPPAPGQVPPQVRSWHEPRRRAERCRSATGRTRCYPDLVLLSQDRGRKAAGRRRGRDRRIGQSPRGAGAVGASSAAARGVPPVRAGRHGRRRAAADARTTRSTSPKSGATTSSATRCASRWCTAAAKRRQRRDAPEAGAKPARRRSRSRPRRAASRAEAGKPAAAKDRPKTKPKAREAEEGGGQNRRRSKLWRSSGSPATSAAYEHSIS